MGNASGIHYAVALSALAWIAPCAAQDVDGDTWIIANVEAKPPAPQFFVRRKDLFSINSSGQIWLKVYGVSVKRVAIDHIMMHVAMNCQSEQIIVQNLYAYRPDGTFMQDVADDALRSQVQPIAPETPMDAVRKMVCAEK